MRAAEYHALVASKMSEDELTKEVAALCKTFGVWRYHTTFSVGSVSGWPDEVLVGRSVIYRELKRKGKDPTANQQRVLDRLAAAGQDVGVWRPEDWFSGRIQQEIQAIATIGKVTT